MTGGYWHNLALIVGLIVHYIPGVLTVVSSLVTLGLAFSILAYLDGADLELPVWVAMVLCGPVAFLLLLPWCMEVYS